MPKKKDVEREDNGVFAPRTLIEAVEYFSDPDVAFSYAVMLRWPDGVTCPFCGSPEHSFISTRKTWKCRSCKKQFSARVGTIFEDSPISFSKWFAAIWMLSNCKNGISSYELHRAIGITQKSAWFMLHRIRAAIKARTFDKKLSGIVEADESFIGGLFKNMHESKKKRIRRESDAKGAKTQRGAIGKTIVQAVLERKGDVRAQILASTHIEPRATFLEENVETGSRLMTDEGYNHPRFSQNFVHDFVNHEIQYVRGNVHCNGVENFWSLLQRTLAGTYVNVEPFHLSAYVDEQCFRFNMRKTDDATRFVMALSQTKGVRLTYKDLTRAEPLLQEV